MNVRYDRSAMDGGYGYYSKQDCDVSDKERQAR